MAGETCRGRSDGEHLALSVVPRSLRRRRPRSPFTTSADPRRPPPLCKQAQGGDMGGGTGGGCHFRLVGSGARTRAAS